MEITHIALGERSIPLTIRRHSKARRISLRLSAARDGIVMTLPRRTSVGSGIDFFKSKAAWVLANVETGKSVLFADGVVLPILGRDVTIRHVTGRGVSKLEGAELCIHGQPEFMTRRASDFLKKYLREECLKQAKAMAKALGKTVQDVRIRDMRSRWGSCSSQGALVFNWRLVFAPSFVLHYLIAHEVAHLAEMNHGTRFWDKVALLCPQMESARKWLKKEGHKLHCYGKENY